VTGIGFEKEKVFLVGESIKVSVVLEEPLDRELVSFSERVLLFVGDKILSSEVGF